MRRFTLAAVLLCALLLPAPAAAEGSPAGLVFCEYSVRGGMENEDLTYTVRLDDSPDDAVLTVAENGRFEGYALPRQALDDLAELMAAYDPAGWPSLPEREEFALDAPARRIALVYEDGSEYALLSDRDAGGPIFADTERLLRRYIGDDPELPTDDDAGMSRVAGAYRYEKEGFGGDFTIVLNADGTYTFYEGPLSSYMGGGTWRVRGGAVHMTERNGFDLRFEFGVGDGALIYHEEGSDAFPYVEVSDADRFIRQDAAD